jgi:hypothetical protein
LCYTTYTIIKQFFIKLVFIFQFFVKFAFQFTLKSIAIFQLFIQSVISPGKHTQPTNRRNTIII